MSALVAHIEAKNAKTREWLAEDPENRFAGLIVEDPDHWAEYGVYTPEQYDRYMLEQDFWELYKEVHGFRPRHVNVSEMSTEDLEAEIRQLAIAEVW